MGIQEVKLEEICLDLFKEIETSLPDYDLLVGLIKRYFAFNRQRKVGFLIIDEEDFFMNFNNCIDRDESGLIKINVKLPGDEHKIPFVFLVMTMLTHMTFQVNQSCGVSSTYNHMLIHEQSEIFYYLALLVLKTAKVEQVGVVYPIS